MFNPNDTFVNLFLSGEVFAHEIDDFVDAWHDGNDPQTLSDFLGMTDDEYAIWVERPEVLREILKARQPSLQFKKMIISRARDQSSWDGHICPSLFAAKAAVASSRGCSLRTRVPHDLKRRQQALIFIEYVI